VSTSSHYNAASKSNRSGCMRLIFIGSVLSPLIILCLVFVITPFFQSGGGEVFTREVPGDAKFFDPIAGLPQVQAFAGENVEVISIKAYYVRSDGTMDLTATSYHPYVDYEFVHQVPAPADAPPVGAGGTLNGKWYQTVNVKAYEPGQWRHVTSGSSEYSYMNKGLERDEDRPRNYKSDTAGMPQCSFKTLWSVAKEKGAPEDAVATIEYTYRGYDFRIRDTDVDLEFSPNCHLKTS
jgi:hypothetical protein